MLDIGQINEHRMLSHCRAQKTTKSGGISHKKPGMLRYFFEIAAATRSPSDEKQPSIAHSPEWKRPSRQRFRPVHGAPNS